MDQQDNTTTQQSVTERQLRRLVVPTHSPGPALEGGGAAGAQRGSAFSPAPGGQVPARVAACPTPPARYGAGRFAGCLDPQAPSPGIRW
jgi:hypothetical protein